MDTKKTLELVHYVVLAVVLLLGWVWLMGILGGNIPYTIVAWSLLLFFSDQALHKYLLDEDFIWSD